MTPLSKNTGQFIKKLVLRGPFLYGWVHIKIWKWQIQYLHKISSDNQSKKKANHLPRNPIPKAKRKKVPRRVLIICDEMWERSELLPELRAITSAELLDIKILLENGIINLDKLASEIQKLGKNPKFDVILLYLNAKWLSEDLFYCVRDYCTNSLLGMNLDDKAEFFDFGPGESKRFSYGRWVNHFDLNLSSSRLFKKWYDDQGGKYFYCPPGLHIPGKLSPPSEKSFQRAIAFLGSAKPERIKLVHYLSRLGVKVETFGKGWPSSQWTNESRSIFRQTQLNLGMGFASGSQKITQLKARDFECPGIGSCYLTTYDFELCEHWDLGKEILCYRSLEELVEMISFYGKKPDTCLKIAQAAFKRAKSNHTWEWRFRKIFNHLNFSC